jgi:5-(carboxyamino)imidazole ribonucleotide synthase
MSQVILPPQCLGILGGGQLGRMFTIAARQMGYKVAVLEPDISCPAGSIANYHIKTNYDDKAGLDELAKLSQVITTEFENIPAQSLDYLSKTIQVYPRASAILIAQNRLKEKAFFNRLGIATTKYLPILSIADIDNVTLDMFPAILKTNTLGYDGKGQIRVNNLEELKSGFEKLSPSECILEKLVDLKLEVSVVVARSHNETIAYPVAENMHKNGILDITIAPARIDKQLKDIITNAGLSIIQNLDYIGVLAIEFFITTDNQILANEMAPRPHNSGHHTLDANLTSQFEQQVRAICNLKLGNTDHTSNGIMLNLLGDIWANEFTHPKWDILAKYDNLKLHLYDKLSAKAGRKMGHLTVLGNDINQLLNQINNIKQELEIK